MRKILTWILIMAMPLVMLSSCSLAGNEYKNLCGFMKSLMGKDISSAESLIEKQYGIELSRGEPEYRDSLSLKGVKITEDRYEYKVTFTACGIIFDTIYLNYNNLKDDGYDGTVYLVQFANHSMSRTQADETYKSFVNEYSKFLKSNKLNEGLAFEYDESLSSSFTDKGYYFYLGYHYSGRTGAASFTASAFES